MGCLKQHLQHEWLGVIVNPPQAVGETSQPAAPPFTPPSSPSPRRFAKRRSCNKLEIAELAVSAPRLKKEFLCGR